MQSYWDYFNQTEVLPMAIDGSVMAIKAVIAGWAIAFTANGGARTVATVAYAIQWTGLKLLGSVRA